MIIKTSTTIYTRTIHVILFVAALLFTLLGLDYCGVDISETAIWQKHCDLLNDNYAIDQLFIGSSHVQRSIAPLIIDTYTQAKSYNAGSGSQDYDLSLYLLEETLQHHPNINTVYLEMYPGIWSYKNYDERVDLNSIYHVTNHMPFSWNKIKLLLHASSHEHYVNSFFILRRMPEQILDLTENIQRAKNKNTSRQFTCQGAAEELRGYQAIESSSSAELRSIMTYEPIDIDENNPYHGDHYQTLLKIIQLCQSKNIKLVLFVQPELPNKINAFGNYQEYHDFLASLSQQFNLEFYDFNFVKEDYFDATDPDILFCDDHLTILGGEKLSHLFGKLISGQLDKTEVFYDSLSEKQNKLSPTIYGVTKNITDDQQKWDFTVVAQNLNQLKYRVILIDQNGKSIVAVDWTNEPHFQIDASFNEDIIIEWKNETDVNKIYQRRGNIKIL